MKSILSSFSLFQQKIEALNQMIPIHFEQFQSSEECFILKDSHSEIQLIYSHERLLPYIFKFLTSTIERDGGLSFGEYKPHLKNRCCFPSFCLEEIGLFNLLELGFNQVVIKEEEIDFINLAHQWEIDTIIIPSRSSEFTSLLPFEEQYQKLLQGFSIFSKDHRAIFWESPYSITKEKERLLKLYKLPHQLIEEEYRGLSAKCSTYYIPPPDWNKLVDRNFLNLSRLIDQVSQSSALIDNGALDHSLPNLFPLIEIPPAKGLFSVVGSRLEKFNQGINGIVIKSDQALSMDQLDPFLISQFMMHGIKSGIGVQTWVKTYFPNFLGLAQWIVHLNDCRELVHLLETFSGESLRHLYDEWNAKFARLEKLILQQKKEGIKSQEKILEEIHQSLILFSEMTKQAERRKRSGVGP